MKYSIGLFIINMIKNSIRDEGDIRDIKDLIIYDIKPGYILLFLSLIALLALIFFMGRKKNNIKKEEMPVLPPDITALEKIKRLKRSKLIEQGRIKEYYTILSDIIRAFMKDEYKISALDRTTYELVSELKNKNIFSGKAVMIQNFLLDCDLVKFAKYIPPVEDPDKILNTAEEIINIAINERAKVTKEITADV